MKRVVKERQMGRKDKNLPGWIRRAVKCATIVKNLYEEGECGPLATMVPELDGEDGQEFVIGQDVVPVDRLPLLAEELLRIAREHGFMGKGAIAFGQWMGECMLLSRVNPEAVLIRVCVLIEEDAPQVQKVMFAMFSGMCTSPI